MSDPLAALSLLLTVFTVVFGLWQPTAASLLKVKPERHRANRNDQIASTGQVLRMMFGLVVVSACLTGIFMPRAFGIVSDALTEGGSYDDLRTAFVAAESVFASLFLLAVSYAVRLARLRWALSRIGEIDPDAWNGM